MRRAGGGLAYAISAIVLLGPIAFIFTAEVMHYATYRDWFGYGLHVDVTNLQAHVADVGVIVTIDVDVRNCSMQPVVVPGPTRTDHATYLSMQPSRHYRFRVEEWDNAINSWKTVGQIAPDSFWYAIISRRLWFRAIRTSGLHLSNWKDLPDEAPPHPGTAFRGVVETLDKTSRIDSTMYSAPVESPDIHYRVMSGLYWRTSTARIQPPQR